MVSYVCRQTVFTIIDHSIMTYMTQHSTKLENNLLFITLGYTEF
jgi:hypothetical protein